MPRFDNEYGHKCSSSLSGNCEEMLSASTVVFMQRDGCHREEMR